MKRIIAIAGIILLVHGMFSCKNKDREFPDFDYTTSYFPYQYPVRTLVLGDFYYDNTLDNNLQFLISAAMGGVYENAENRTVNFTVDESLTDDLFFDAEGTKPVLPLPTGYYTLSDTKITIPSGKMSGSIMVQLADAFLNDPLAVSNNYVVPLRITSATTDSILEGSTQNVDPDPRVAGDWIKIPKNFTLFGVKFVNQFSGKYLLKGKNIVTRTVEDTLIENFVYTNLYWERAPIVTVTTTAKDSVSYTNSIRLTGSSPGSFKMLIGFNASNNGTIIKDPTSAFDVTGTARFVEDDAEWGGIKRNVIYLNYVVTEGTRTHTCTDTLCFRDKAVKLEEFAPKVIEP